MKGFDVYDFCEKNTKKLSMIWELSPESEHSNSSEIGLTNTRNRQSILNIIIGFGFQMFMFLTTFEKTINNIR